MLSCLSCPPSARVHALCVHCTETNECICMFQNLHIECYFSMALRFHTVLSTIPSLRSSSVHAPILQKRVMFKSKHCGMQYMQYLPVWGATSYRINPAGDLKQIFTHAWRAYPQNMWLAKKEAPPVCSIIVELLRRACRSVTGANFIGFFRMNQRTAALAATNDWVEETGERDQ